MSPSAMQRAAVPIGAPLQEVLEQARTFDGRPLASCIPAELYQPRLPRGLFGFFMSYALWGGATWAASVAHPALWLPLWLVAGLGGWGLVCIAHDCGHGSFSTSRRLNGLVGHLALLPMLYRFHGWRHTHNLHHAHTNSVDDDPTWRPVDEAAFARMPIVPRVIYAATRSLFFWLGTVHYEVLSGYFPSLLPQAKARAEVRRSIVFVVCCAALVIPALVRHAGVIGLLKYGVAPWICIHAWFSAITLMHHTAEDVPFLAKGQWSVTAAKLLLTIDYRYSAWMQFLTHDSSIHLPHHVAPKIPHYNLPRAQEALKRAFPGVVRERPFRFRDLHRIVTRCHLHDPSTGTYRTFSRAASRGLVGAARLASK